MVDRHGAVRRVLRRCDRGKRIARRTWRIGQGVSRPRRNDDPCDCTWPFWLSVAGIACASFLYLVRTDLPEKLRVKFGPVYTLLDNKYYFDRFNDWFFAGGARLLGRGLWKGGDMAVIDGVFRQWFGQAGRLVRDDRAQTAVRPDIPLCVHHDHRCVRAPDAMVLRS